MQLTNIKISPDAGDEGDSKTTAIGTATSAINKKTEMTSDMLPDMAGAGVVAARRWTTNIKKQIAGTTKW